MVKRKNIKGVRMSDKEILLLEQVCDTYNLDYSRALRIAFKRFWIPKLKERRKRLNDEHQIRYNMLNEEQNTKYRR